MRTDELQLKDWLKWTRDEADYDPGSLTDVDDLADCVYHERSKRLREFLRDFNDWHRLTRSVTRVYAKDGLTRIALHASYHGKMSAVNSHVLDASEELWRLVDFASVGIAISVFDYVKDRNNTIYVRLMDGMLADIKSGAGQPVIQTWQQMRHAAEMSETGILSTWESLGLNAGAAGHWEAGGYNGNNGVWVNQAQA